MKYWTWFQHFMIASCGIGFMWLAGYVLIMSVPPLEWTESEIWPDKAYAGQHFDVRRKFFVKRPQVVTITRKLVRGDCAVECSGYELETTIMTLQPGPYNRVLHHVIPSRATPGIYHLDFAVSWTVMGITFAKNHPPLSIEVVR